MQAELSHERLDVYKVYLKAATLCGDIVSNAATPITAFDHLDRAMESIGVNFMRANGLAFGSPQRATYLDVSIASTHECAASLDVCFAKRSVEECVYTDAMGKLWRVRFMKTAQEHACQTLLMFDLMVARGETTASRVTEGKIAQARVISMLHAWCTSNATRGHSE